MSEALSSWDACYKLSFITSPHAVINASRILNAHFFQLFAYRVVQKKVGMNVLNQPLCEMNLPYNKNVTFFNNRHSHQKNCSVKNELCFLVTIKVGFQVNGQLIS